MTKKYMKPIREAVSAMAQDHVRFDRVSPEMEIVRALFDVVDTAWVPSWGPVARLWRAIPKPYNPYGFGT